MGTFDETARHVQGERAWLAGLAGMLCRRTAGRRLRPLGRHAAHLVAGGPERTDDVVCVLRRRADGKPAHLIVEVATDSRPDDLARLGIYELLLAIEVRAVLGEGPPVYGAILHLTGSSKRGPLMLTCSPSNPGVLVKPMVI